MRFGSLFSGIGGLDLGLERAGMTCTWQVEIDDYATRVLEKHWPTVPKHRDVRACSSHNLAPVDLICGGFPCQPFSIAGHRRGQEDDRNLWPEMRRIVQELKPAWVLGENVPNLARLYLDTVLADLETDGYETCTLEIPACAVDAPHIRNRLYILAYTKGNRRHTARLGPTQPNPHTAGPATDAERHPVLHDEQHGTADANSGRSVWATIEPPVRGMDDGVSHRMDRLRCLGNAVVPQVAEYIGRLIVAADKPPTPAAQG